MRDFNSSDLQRNINITVDIGTRAADSDDVGGEILNEFIAGRDGRRLWNAKVIFENAAPVSTSASQISTPSISASDNNYGAPVPADDMARIDLGFDSAGCAGCWPLHDEQFRLR